MLPASGKFSRFLRMKKTDLQSQLSSHKLKIFIIKWGQCMSSYIRIFNVRAEADAEPKIQYISFYDNDYF